MDKENLNILNKMVGWGIILGGLVYSWFNNHSATHKDVFYAALAIMMFLDNEK